MDSHALVPMKFLSIVSQDPSDSNSSRLHVDIFRFCFIQLIYILQIPLRRLVLLKSRTHGHFTHEPRAMTMKL